ncbi:MAG: universal stress protein [Gemmatimonadaceae bacterium]
MFQTILVPLDQSAFAEQAIAPAAVLARKLGAGMDVVLVHEQSALAELRRSHCDDDQLQEDERYLEHITERLGTHGISSCSHEVLRGEVVDAICTHAEAADIGMIVMTSHGQTGFSRAHLGSVAYGLVRKSSLPVLVLRDAAIAKTSQLSGALFRKILVPLDGSDHSQTVLASVTELARRTDAEIVLLRVIEPVPLFAANFDNTAVPFGLDGHPFLSGNIQDTEATAQLCSSAQAELTDLVAKLAEAQLRNVAVVVLVGRPVAAAIIDYANAVGADLIAMSTHGRGASRWLLGSVADSVLRASNFPLLLSRPQSQEALRAHRTKRAS